MSAQENGSGEFLSQRGSGVLQSLAIVRGIARARRPPGSRLPEWQVTAKHGESCGAECFGDRDQKRRMRVAARAVGQHQAAAVRMVRQVQESANGWLQGVIGERLCGRVGQATILNAENSLRVLCYTPYPSS